MEILLVSLLWILLGLLAFLILMALLILFAPISYKFDGHFSQNSEVKAKLNWLVLGVTLKNQQLAARLLFFDVTKFFMPKPKPKEQAPDTNKMSFKNFWELLCKIDVKKITLLSILLIKRVFRVVRHGRFSAKGVVGFGCPYRTGQFLGLYEAAAGILGLRKNVLLHGSFDEEKIDLKVDFAGRFMPICVIIPALRFVLAPEVQALMKQV